MRKWIFISVLALSAIVCNLGAPQATSVPPTLSLDVASTLIAAASATAEAQATFTPLADASAPEIGTITGKLSYPSSFIPPLRIVAFEVGTGAVRYTDVSENQSTYTFDLPVGTYHVVAYVMDGSFAGGYTRAVICGLAVECADHSLIEVIVTARTITPNIDPGDFYAEENAFPPMPTE